MGSSLASSTRSARAARPAAASSPIGPGFNERWVREWLHLQAAAGGRGARERTPLHARAGVGDAPGRRIHPRLDGRHVRHPVGAGSTASSTCRKRCAAASASPTTVTATPAPTRSNAGPHLGSPVMINEALPALEGVVASWKRVATPPTSAAARARRTLAIAQAFPTAPGPATTPPSTPSRDPRPNSRTHPGTTNLSFKNPRRSPCPATARWTASASATSSTTPPARINSWRSRVRPSNPTGR